MIQITIYEGRNRQVRRMFEAISHPVIRLKRIAFGDLLLQNLKRGLTRPLTKDEINRLIQLAKSDNTKRNGQDGGHNPGLFGVKRLLDESKV